MDGICPFCWNRNISRIGLFPSDGGFRRRLMECGDCEKWYWADSGEEVARLFEICVTLSIYPGRCLEEVREIMSSGGNGFPRQRAAEFNRICSDCSNGCFVSRRTSACVW